VVSATGPHGRSYRFSGLEPILFHSSSSSIIFMRLCTPFQTHYFSKNLVAQRIERGTSGSATRNAEVVMREERGTELPLDRSYWCKSGIRGAEFLCLHSNFRVVFW
jgi:hypothetical protein